MKSRLDIIFRISVILKGLDALFEIVGGVFLLIVSPNSIGRFGDWLTRTKLAENPNDYMATLLRREAHHIAIGTTVFGGIYLLSHGVIKLFVIINVLRNKYWAYPALIIVLFAFIIYQLIDIYQTHSIIMTILTIFDMFVIILTRFEWKKQSSLRVDTTSQEK